MTRSTRAARPARRRTAGRTVATLAVLGLVVTAHAPSVITVAPGDTLWDLAREHGTSVSELRALNDLPGNGTIYAGKTLRLPGAASDGGSSRTGGAELGHTVRSGETLSHLALRYGVPQSAIASRNSISGGRIFAGQRIAIPGARRGATADVPTTSTGVRVPEPVRSSVAENRQVLAGRSHPSKAEARRMVADTARRHGVPVSLAVAVAYHESGFQQRVVSGVNAIGVMQVLPSTGRALSQQTGRDLDLLDTQDNITAGVLLLRQLLRSTGSTDAALAGYYQGLGSIAKKGLLPQTHSYIDSIHVLQRRFANG